jgi:hypothetical protein
MPVTGVVLIFAAFGHIPDDQLSNQTTYNQQAAIGTESQCLDALHRYDAGLSPTLCFPQLHHNAVGGG